MARELVVARNPEPDSALPYLILVPLGEHGIVLKAREAWPRTAKVYCHRVDGWPPDAEVLERHPVRSCTRRGPAIDLLLERARENRSQIVLTMARGREMIFWQTARTSKQARPNVALPKARSASGALEIVVDSGERYAWSFRNQQATTSKRRLRVGDYAVELDGEVVAAVERKSLDDFVSSLLTGKLTYAAAELATLPRAAIVVEDRYSKLFGHAHAAATRVAEGLAELQARFPTVPVTFAETRPLAQEWTYRWFGACLHELTQQRGTVEVEQSFASGADVVLEPVAPTPAEIRAWLREQGVEISSKGRIPRPLVERFEQAHPAFRTTV